MMTPEQIAAEYAEKRTRFIQELIVQRVMGDPLRAALVILEHSYGLRQDAAQFHSQDELAVILGMKKGHCSRAIKELRERAIVRPYCYAGEQCYEPRTPEGWQSADPDERKREVEPAQRRASRSAWQKVRQRSLSDPRQRELIAWKPAEHGDCGLSAILLGLGKDEGPTVTAPVTSYRAGNRDEPSPVTAPVTAQSRARTRAGHVHVPTSVPQSMVHDHGHARSVAEENPLRGLGSDELESRLDDESRFMLESFEGLPGVIAGEYRRTWLLRLNDRWRGVALRALAECLSMRAGGRTPIKGWGQAANYFFKQWKPVGKAPVSNIEP